MKQSTNRHYILPLAVLWAVMLAPGLSTATSVQQTKSISDIPLDQFITRVEKSYRNIKSLEADFVQTYSAGGRVQTESGRVILARGGLMRWEYRQPERKLFLSDGKNVELYLPAEKQIEKSSVKASDDYRIPFRLLLSRLDLRKYFSRIESEANGPKQLSGDRTIFGTPKGGKNRPYDKVLIEFDPALDIRRLVITYRDESVMTFVFSHIVRNPLVREGMFRFSPPAGTAIINPENEGGS